MTNVIYQQREVWQHIPNFEQEWRIENRISKLVNNYAIQAAKSKSSSFIVDWQLNDSSSNAVQLSLFFKEK